MTLSVDGEMTLLIETSNSSEKERRAWSEGEITSRSSVGAYAAGKSSYILYGLYCHVRRS